MTQAKPEALVVEPPTTAANVYDQTSQTAVSPEATDIEAQKTAPADAPGADSGYDDEAGKSLGIAMFLLLVIGFAIGWIGGNTGLIFIIVPIVIASTITCGCCCASNLNIDPRVKRWATATLICLVLQLILTIIAVIIVMTGATMGDTTGATAGTGIVLLVVTQILYILAAIFAGIFTWGRKCGRSRGNA
ncbi:hypothetical protein HJC23_005636 [Cyclotella cryptica]|uniref:Uncharacterized protein n=1 Tax=Cyclotella cryptica TaxID=29204 RepID=A0ABD3PYB1_9STRA|eukprot:CCRYP_010500-RA/>CCRYP_010500-RA protein AED:0.20 eAED:0.20 QI:0/-1/0/1/-1/1/1/0/189